MIARVPALLAAVALAFAASPAGALRAAEIPERVTSAAVWAPPEGFVASMHLACDRNGGDFGACFVAEMVKTGAPSAVVAFARRTDNQGYLEIFRSTGGAVDVAIAQYPFRANENTVSFLVNGSPPLLDVDDPRYLDRDALRRNAVFAGVLRAHPNAAVFPGPRSTADAIVATRLIDGGQVFRVPYVLTDGCHACARLGELRLDFDFDAAGRFAGTRVASVRAGSR